MPVTFNYPINDYSSAITLYADSISVGVVSSNKAIPIRDVKAARTKHPIYIRLGWTGQTIKISGYIDNLTTFTKLLNLYPDTLLRTSASVGNYAEFDKLAYWEIKEISTDAVSSDTFLRKYSLTVVEQHHVEDRG